MKPASIAQWLLLAGLLMGCVTGEFRQVSINEPVDLEMLHRLRAGEDDLTTCLQALGAPTDVREYRVSEDGHSGMALVWSWSEQVGWGLRFSSTLYKQASASFEFDWAGTYMPGCVLWFDQDLMLESYREGMVGELLAAPRRPSPAVGS